FDQIRTQVASAFGVPETMIADAANYATAKEHRLSFYQDTVIPKADQIQHALNRQLFEAQGLEFVFQFDQIEAIQKDEAEKAEYMRMLVDGKIITKDEARDALGYEPMDAAQEEELKPPAPDFTPNPQNNPQNPQPDVEPDVNQKALEAAVQDDLRKWEKKALSKG
ncbi:MAG: phage portal protein, partial [Anaerolineae bacterium]|nr:phage portal protein [Anaerolineae bacterium]